MFQGIPINVKNALDYIHHIWNKLKSNDWPICRKVTFFPTGFLKSHLGIDLRYNNNKIKTKSN